VKQKLGSTIQFAVLLLLVIVQAGCIKKTTRLPASQLLLPAKDATRAELLQTLEATAKRIASLKATVAIDYSSGGAKSGVLEEYRETKGYLFVDRPSHIRIQVQAPLVLTTVAVMVSDGLQYRVSVPVKNLFAIEDVNAPVSTKNSMINLRPKVFLDALFVDVMPYLNKPNVNRLFEEAVVGIRSYYIFTFVDTTGPELQLLEKIWIDRTDLQVGRKQIFGKDGRMEQDVEYQEYHQESGIPYPKTVVIRRPVEEFTVKLTFQQTTMNEKLDAKVFELPRPEGSQLMQLTQ
jgi:outer membrane lipoprotein-sorting protein